MISRYESFFKKTLYNYLLKIYLPYYNQFPFKKD
jgi:hypothetical protein